MGTGPYAGQTASLATRHAKEQVITPAFADALAMDVVVVDIDTDAFGTFAGDIPRIDTPVNTAIAKARAAMKESGRSFGIASEGTIGPDPLMPLITSDIESIVFVDDQRGIVISESLRSTDIVAHREIVTPDGDLARLLDRFQFPAHGVMVRPGPPAGGPIRKGITDESTLIAAIIECASIDGTAVVESDLRACYSPSRMRNIHLCAEKLALRISTLCQQCESPGWGRIEPARGLPCSACGTTVEAAIRADVYGCPACPATHEVPRPEQFVDPRWCPWCNP